MPRGLSAVFLAAAVLAASAAHAVVDVPTSERRALELVDLACGAGIAGPVDTAVLPLDDAAYLRAFRALRPLGFVDPIGAQRDARAQARADGGLHGASLVPRVELRAYALGGTDERLLYHTSGNVLHEGFNAFLSISGDASWRRRLGGGYEARVQEFPGDFDAAVKRLYLKGRLGKWSLKVGRDAVRLGPGYHGSLLLDDNAQAFDLWQVRTEDPLLLPGFLTGLGGFRFTLLNAYLSDPHPETRDGTRGGVEDPMILGMRSSYHPTTWFDVGLSRAVEYGGRGRHAYDRPKDWWELFSAAHENVFPGRDNAYDNEQYAALDFTMRLPFLNGLGPLKAGKLYWEHAGTDIVARWQGDGTWGARLTHLGDIAGLYLSTTGTDLRAEWARTDPAWYIHHEYLQDYTYRGLPLGHHMGGDAQDLFFQAARYFGPAWRASLSLDLEERGRSGPEPEKRTEWQFAVEGYRFEAFGASLAGRLEALWADVRHPLDDPAGGRRDEFYLGLSVGTQR